MSVSYESLPVMREEQLLELAVAAVPADAREMTLPDATGEMYKASSPVDGWRLATLTDRLDDEIDDPAVYLLNGDAVHTKITSDKIVVFGNDPDSAELPQVYFSGEDEFNRCHRFIYQLNKEIRLNHREGVMRKAITLSGIVLAGGLLIASSLSINQESSNNEDHARSDTTTTEQDSTLGQGIQLASTKDDMIGIGQEGIVPVYDGNLDHIEKAQWDTPDSVPQIDEIPGECQQIATVNPVQEVASIYTTPGSDGELDVEVNGHGQVIVCDTDISDRDEVIVEVVNANEIPNRLPGQFGGNY